MRQKHRKTVGGIAFGWWARNVNADTGVARKTRSQLRRASRASEVLAIEATHMLHSQLATLDAELNYKSDRYPIRLALLAHVVAGIETDGKTSIPAGLGRMVGEKRVMSELRFQRIISASDDWELANRLRRSMATIKGHASVSGTANDLFYWGETVRNRWCFQYFGSALPEALQDQSESDTSKEI